MVVLGLGGVMAAVSTIWMATEPAGGIALAVLSFSLIGLGVSACGTSLLTLMAKQVPDQKRAQAATTVWLMMIMGFAITAGTVGKLIDPYTPEILLKVSASLSLLTTCITALCLWRLEKPTAQVAPENKPTAADFKQTFKEVWSEPKARTFTIFVFLSMLAYSAQDLILEPFAGVIHGMTPGKTTQLSGWHHMGVLIGMLSVAGASTRWVAGRLGSVQAWMVGGCVFSAIATVGLSSSALINMTEGWPLKANVIFLGVANGAFSIAAIATMMRLAGEGGPGREGTRMGLWGAAQAAAFGLGGLVGTGASDLAHALLQDSRSAYVAVFAFQSLMFLASAVVAMRMRAGNVKPSEMSIDNHVLWKGGSAS